MPSANAGAGAPRAEIISVTVNRSDPTTAFVEARYTCFSGPHDDESWLWVSAKQVKNGAKNPALTQEESSEISSAWLQRHPLGEFTCDAKNHRQTFMINTQEDPITHTHPFGHLVNGQVWVQFCLDDGQGNFISQGQFVPVTFRNGTNPI